MEYKYLPLPPYSLDKLIHTLYIWIFCFLKSTKIFYLLIYLLILCPGRRLWSDCSLDIVS